MSTYKISYVGPLRELCLSYHWFSSIVISGSNSVLIGHFMFEWYVIRCKAKHIVWGFFLGGGGGDYMFNQIEEKDRYLI